MSKTKTILVSYPHERVSETHAPDGSVQVNTLYRVEKLTDSVEYNPGQLLSKQQVNELCEASGWAVTVAKVR